MRGCARTRGALFSLLLFLAIPAFAISDIAVTRNWDGVAVPNGGSFAFPDPVAVGATDSRLFRISNTGNTNLNLTNATSLVSGACFSQIETPVTPIAPGGFTTFRVRLQCATSGMQSGSVTIRSDDPDENPYTFSLSGNVTAPPPPDISVWREWDGGAVANGGSVSFANTIPAGAPDSLRFRISNNGTTSLNLTNATALVSGTCFSQIETPVTPVAAGGSSYVRVRLQCATAGTYTGTVTISSNDPDENPYRFYVTGTVTPPPPPDISVWRDWDNVGVPQNGTVNFLSPIPANVADSLRFCITNNGTGSLDLTNSTTLVSGTCFSQIETPLTPVAPGGSSWVRVRLQCATPGTYTGTVTVSSNDPDENPYRFYVTGTVTNPGAPEIAVTRAWDNVAVASGGSFAFPDPVRAGATDSRLFYISNSGNAPLNIANPTTLVSGTCFSQIETPVNPVPVGGQSQFRVRLQCAAAGNYTGTVSIQSNDADENPYTISLSGTVIANGATYVSHVFPTAMNANQFYDVSVTMRNSGTTTWTNAKNYRLGIRPDGAGTAWRIDGRLYLTAADSIAPGASKTFTARLQAPSTAGTYSLQWQMVEELVEWFGPVTPLITVTVGAPRNDAAFVSQSVPATMNAGQKYTVSVTMRNTGGTTWSETAHHRLAIQIPGDPFTHRRLLPAGVTVAPGAQYTFSWQVTAPATAGTYTFQWRMVEELVEWFGPFTPSTPVTVRIATPPVVNSVTPDTIRAGTIQTVTVTGHRLNNTTVKFGSLDASIVSPAATLLSVSPDGTSMTVRVDASNTAIDGFHALIVKNGDGNGAGEVRIVPARPVVDVYTPSQASWGDLYFFSASGVNLSGVQVVPMTGAVQIVNVEGDDGLISGILEVDSGAGDIDTTIELRGAGGVTSIPLQLRGRTELTQKTSLAGQTSATGSQGVWIQNPVSLLPAPPKNKFLDWEITCRYSRSRSRGRSGTIILLKELGKRLNPNVLQGFLRGEIRTIETVVAVYGFSVTISVEIWCRINSEGVEDFDIYFCIAVEAYAETVGFGGQRISLEACTGTDSHIDISGSGFWNFHYRFQPGGTSTTSPCVSATDRSPNPFSGSRITDLKMDNCCPEELTVDMSYKLGEDPGDFARTLKAKVGEMTPNLEFCPFYSVTITNPPHDPEPDDLADNYSFLAQRAHAGTETGDTITATVIVGGVDVHPEQTTWSVTSAIGGIQQVQPPDRKGPQLTFIPDAPNHPQYVRGSANCTAGFGNPWNGSCERSEPLEYDIRAQYDENNFDVNTIVQDEVDIIRQEYRNHNQPVPARSSFSFPTGSLFFPENQINVTPYRVIVGTPGALADDVYTVFNALIHDDEQLVAPGTANLSPETPIVAPGARIDEVGFLLTTRPCYRTSSPNCDDRISGDGDFILAGPNGIAETEARAELTNVGLRLTNTWRNPERNEAVGGVLNSRHQFGDAIDIQLTGGADNLTETQLWCILQTAGVRVTGEAYTEIGPVQVPCRTQDDITHVHVER